jgi:hypothetical protein
MSGPMQFIEQYGGVMLQVMLGLVLLIVIIAIVDGRKDEHDDKPRRKRKQR